MSLGTMLGVVSGDRVLLLGSGDSELETSLALALDGPVERSLTGNDVPPGAFRVVALSREATRRRDERGTLLAAAARALDARGTLIAEFPNTLAPLSRPFLAFEGLGDRRPDGRGGTTYGACRRLARRAGLGRTSGFLCLPSLADPRVMLPLDSPPALAYHYAAPFYVESRRRRLLRRLLGFAVRLGVLSVASPGFTVVASKDALS